MSKSEIINVIYKAVFEVMIQGTKERNHESRRYFSRSTRNFVSFNSYYHVSFGTNTLI